MFKLSSLFHQMLSTYQLYFIINYISNFRLDMFVNLKESFTETVFSMMKKQTETKLGLNSGKYDEINQFYTFSIHKEMLHSVNILSRKIYLAQLLTIATDFTDL